MTQCERILQYMRKFGSITNREAVVLLDIMRLASRIHDLQKQGYNIKRENVKRKFKNGEFKHYTRYSLEGEQ